MRRLVLAVFLIGSVVGARAGVLVELTDGTTLTVESHWSDGDQVHLVRGGVDMIVPKANIKSMDENVADPEVAGRGAEGKAGAGDRAQADGADDAGAAGEPEVVPGLSEMSAEELEAIHVAESDKLLELQDKRFTSKYNRSATPEERQQADAAFLQQNKRNAAVWFALEKARKAEATGAAPAVSAVEQPQ